MKFKLLYSIAIGIAICTASGASENQWRSECVGRLIIDLPGNSTVAGVSPTVFREELITPSQSTQYQFPDGQRALWARLLYKGELLISNNLSGSQKESIGAAFESSKERVKERLAQRSDGTKIPSVDNLAGLPSGSRAWYTESSVRLLIDIGDHLLFTRITASPGEPSNSEIAKGLAKNISYRPVFHIPSKAGICLPHAFVKDADASIRNIGVVYKMVDHPDVTIYLRESNAASYNEKNRQMNAEPKRLNENFWAQYELNKSVKRIVSIERADLRFTSLSESQNGFASIAHIERTNGELDYGYIGVLRGNPESKDSPDLELVILMDSSSTKSKGIVPISKEHFVEIVRKLPTTVRFNRN